MNYFKVNQNSIPNDNGNINSNFNENINDFFDIVVSRAVEGWNAGAFKFESAEVLSKHYLRKYKKYSYDELIEKVIQSQATRNFGVGFATSVGGFITLPLQLSAGIAGNLIIQSRLVAIIALISGLDVNTYQTKTLIKLLVIGLPIEQSLRNVGLKFGKKMLLNQLNKIPKKTLRAINKFLGAKIITKAGKKSLTSFVKLVPIIGAIIGGIIDYIVCINFGKYAARELKKCIQEQNLLA